MLVDDLVWPLTPSPVARRRTLFDDRPVEINELTFIIKQDLNALNQQILGLQAISAANGNQQARRGAAQEGEHNKNVVVLLQGKLTDVSASFKDVLEERTKNIQASRSRTEDFISSVTQHVQVAPPSGVLASTSSPLYNTPSRGTPAPPGGVVSSTTAASSADVLSLRPAASDQQLLLMEEAQGQNAYIEQRGEAIEMIERTIGELGSIFSQLASMVQEQGDQIQRIDAHTDDIVDNVEGAQRELLKYWSRVSSNRWLMAKMFGVLMIFFLLWVLVAG
jgi:syntaxin 5